MKWPTLEQMVTRRENLSRLFSSDKGRASCRVSTSGAHAHLIDAMNSNGAVNLFALTPFSGKGKGSLTSARAGIFFRWCLHLVFLA